MTISFRNELGAITEKEMAWTDTLYQCIQLFLTCPALQCWVKAYFGGIIRSNHISSSHSLTSPPAVRQFSCQEVDDIGTSAQSHL